MRKIFSIILICCSILQLSAQSSMNASQVLAKAVAVMSNSKGVEAKFSIGSSGYNGSGTILSVTPKYYVSLPEVEVWYNGKDLFTLNKNTDETTIVTPTSEELAQSNPLAYVTGASANYNVAFSTLKKAGKYVLELTPKKKTAEVKRITLTLNQSNYVPEKIVIEPKRGNPITSEINSFKTGISVSSSQFEYTTTKYPKVEIIDLR